MKSKQKYFAALVAAHRLWVHPEQFQSNALKAAQDQINWRHPCRPTIVNNKPKIGFCGKISILKKD